MALQDTVIASTADVRRLFARLRQEIGTAGDQWALRHAYRNLLAALGIVRQAAAPDALPSGVDPGELIETAGDEFQKAIRRLYQRADELGISFTFESGAPVFSGGPGPAHEGGRRTRPRTRRGRPRSGR